MFKDIRENEQERTNTRRLLEAKILNQYQFANSKNKITNTDFLTHFEQESAKKFLQEKLIQNVVFFGGNGEDSDRNILIFYPEKFTKEIVEKNYEKIVSAVQVSLPKEVHYEHRIYLSGIMKLGVRREKIGDILIRENGADIIILDEIADFLESHLGELTRFKSARINRIKIGDVEPQKREFEELVVIVSSMRLDNFVAEFSRTSRTKAVERINGQKVFVNEQLETRFSKKIKEGDVITVRGKGKFKIEKIANKTKSDRFLVNVKKYS